MVCDFACTSLHIWRLPVSIFFFLFSSLAVRCSALSLDLFCAHPSEVHRVRDVCLMHLHCFHCVLFSFSGFAWFRRCDKLLLFRSLFFPSFYSSLFYFFFLMVRISLVSLFLFNLHFSLILVAVPVCVCVSLSPPSTMLFYASFYSCY